MKHNFVKIIVATCTAYLSFSSASQAQTPIERPTLKVGDSWSFQRIDLWKNQPIPGIGKRTVAEVSNDEIRFDMLGFSGTASTDLRSLNWNTVQAIRGEKIERPVFQWPLIAGKKNTLKYPWINSRNNEGNDDGNCVYHGMEQVKVPAGEFSAFKIVCAAYWRNTTSNNSFGRWENTYWYSPATKWTVKQKNMMWYGDRLGEQTQDELVEFKLN